MDTDTLKEKLIDEASHDIFNGVGRLFLDEFTKTFNVSVDEILTALKDIEYPFRIVNENILLITLQKRR